MNSKVALFLLPSLLASLLFTSCRTAYTSTDFKELAKASIRLGMDIGYDDNKKLYIEASKWIGTPYRYGGASRYGVDCSGFTQAIYSEVYGKDLSRTADRQLKNDCRRVKKRNLQEGDLVFFKDSRKSKDASHVGIYLKDNKFIHASTSRGVIVSDLSESFYDKTWLAGGRAK